MIGGKDAFNSNVAVGKIVGELLDVMVKAGILNDDCATIVFNNENLIVNRIARLIGVKGEAVIVVYAHNAMIELSKCAVSLLHDRSFLFVVME